MSGTLFGHPRPLYTLFFTELWERFSYYGMRALLILFMTLPAAQAGLGLSVGKSALIYGTYTMSVYLMSIPGGAVADCLLGARRSVLAGGILIACGHFCLAAEGRTIFFAGLALLVIGTGLLKPNISAMVGALYSRDEGRRDAGFSIFYLGINLGAMAAPFATGFLAQYSWFKGRLASWGFDPARSWHWGFAAAGVGMLIGLATFILFGAELEPFGGLPPAAPRRWGKPLIALAGTAGLWVIVWLSDQDSLAGRDFTWIRWLFLGVPALLCAFLGRARTSAARRLAGLLFYFVGAVVFWALFEQAGSSLSLFADRFTQTRFLGIEFPSSWYQSANPLFIIVLAIGFSALWTKLGDRQPSSAVKFGLGLALLAAAFGLMVPAARLSAAGRVSPWWLIGLYFLQSCGELCLSPVGLAAFTRLSPRRLVGAVLGLWFLADAFGNKFAGVMAGSFGAGAAGGLPLFFGRQAAVVAAVAALFLLLAPWVRRISGEGKG